MKTMMLFILFLLVGGAAWSQSNTAVVKYNLERYTLSSTVGGDLVIEPNQPIRQPVRTCELRQPNFQVVFQSDTPRSIAIDVDNNGGGDSCVTLLVETSSGSIRKVIADDAELGVHRFSNVKKISLSIEHPLATPSEIPAKSSGTATLWF